MQNRKGAVGRGTLIALGSIVILGVLGWALTRLPEQFSRPPATNGSASSNTPAGEGGRLLVYCAAGLKPPIAAIAEQFQKELGIEVELQYGGSGTLLTNLQVAKTGDLFLAADESYIGIAREKGVLSEAIPLARQRPVIAVLKGNPKNIQSVDDLLREDVTIALANPEAASIGKVSKAVLEKEAKWEALAAKAKVFKPTVNDVAADVSLGTVDATIVWDATVRQMPKLDLVHVPAFDEAVQSVMAGILESCKHPALALQFARYLQAPEKGQPVFAKEGYETLEGDVWETRPSVTLYSGGLNRTAIEQTIADFEVREGAKINTVYNGCGILVGQIRAGFHPDGYFACDTSYITNVSEHFLAPKEISETEMLIVVQNGNPHGIKTLSDLTKDGLKIGVANPEQSALGGLTKNLLEPLGYWEPMQKNIKVQTPTADLLVNDMLTGALDAVIVYRVNVSKVRDKLEIVPIQEGNPLAVQPIAIGKDSKHKYLMERLIEALTSAQSRERFQAVDFRWRAAES